MQPSAASEESAVSEDARQIEPISIARGMSIVVAALVLFVLADLAAGLSIHKPQSLEDRLPIPMDDGDVYLLGNSMFKTGIDVDQLAAILPTESVKFSYHDGYYTNLWYLMTKNAIASNEARPAVLVWGFRPTYANQPAFQKTESPDIDTFSLDDEPFWENVVSNRGRVPIVRTDSFMASLGDLSVIHSNRESIQGTIQTTMNQATVGFLDAAGASFASALRASLVDGDDAVSDVLLRAVTGGEIQLSEELVVDRGEGFIVGPIVTFDQSFVPHIAALLNNADVQQLVLIFKPVAHLEGKMSPDAIEFASDAAAYLEDKGILFVNFLDDDSIVHTHYAKGDHYNDEGRSYLTELVGEKLAQLLGELES